MTAETRKGWAHGNAGKGRRAGVPNKLTIAAREAFQLAFDGLGGVPRLTEWAQENTTEFYKLYGRLIPTEVVGAGGAPLLPPVLDVRYVSSK